LMHEPWLLEAASRQNVTPARIPDCLKWTVFLLLSGNWPETSGPRVRGKAIRALIIGGGIGGLAAAIALQRVGIEAVVFEKAPQITEVGAGLSLWSNAMIALRRLGLEAAALEAGSRIERTRAFLSTGEPFGSVDFAALGEKAGAPSTCLHRATLQHLLLEAALAADPRSVQTGRECTGFEADGAGVAALFSDASRERGDVLIGADGIHSVIRPQLFGSETLRFAGYLAWRGIAERASLLPEGEPLVVVGRGTQAGCFHCGERRLYWFLTRNAAPGSHAGPFGNRGEVIECIKNWRVPFRSFVEATKEDAILRTNVVDRPARRVSGVGRVTLLGDAIHATTPNLGQGACQALEDAVVLAHSLCRFASAEAGLRGYETRRQKRANFVIGQSWRIGSVVQLANPVGVWLRKCSVPHPGRRSEPKRLFERLLRIDLPELAG
jgi:2-polyprenyl-6-methoxyphenol hydroxylase-like FAD-dependent oxidoreductase